MTTRQQTISRLRRLTFLIDEALRLADDGKLDDVAAKLSEANDRVCLNLRILISAKLSGYKSYEIN